MVYIDFILCILYLDVVSAAHALISWLSFYLFWVLYPPGSSCRREGWATKGGGDRAQTLLAKGRGLTRGQRRARVPATDVANYFTNLKSNNAKQ